MRNYTEGALAVIDFNLTASGEASAPSAALDASDFSIYREDGAKRSTMAGVTVSILDSKTGAYLAKIETSDDTDSGFYQTNKEYFLMATTAKTVDSKSIEGLFAGRFAIEKMFEPDLTTVDGKVDTIQADVTTIDGKVDSIQTDLTTVDGKVDTLQTDLTTVDGKVDTIQADVAAIKGTGFIESTDSLPAIRETIDLIDTGGGSGAIEVILTIQADDDSDDVGDSVVEGATVWIRNNADDTTIAGPLKTNSSGLVTFWLDAGTYKLYVKHASINKANPVNTIVVTSSSVTVS